MDERYELRLKLRFGGLLELSFMRNSDVDLKLISGSIQLR